MVDVEQVMDDPTVVAALREVASIQKDLDDFDGDRRGILAALWEARAALVTAVLKAGVPGIQVSRYESEM